MQSSEDEVRRQADLEIAAEEVEDAKFYLIELDRRQNQFREAKRKLLRKEYDEPIWLLCSGSTFVRSDLDQSDTVRYLEWRLSEGETEIESARESLKQKVASLAELEGPDSALAHLYKGFDLHS